MNIEREKELYSQIEDYRSQIEGLYAEIKLLTDALVDITMCNIPGMPTGETVRMDQFGPFARERAFTALKDIGFYKTKVINL